MVLLFSKAALLIILTTLVYADGNQGIVHFSELISDEDFIASGEDNSQIRCQCVYRNCSCINSSLDYALANLTSSALINITTDTTLSSLAKASYIENVSIIGHNNPTVNCKMFGGINLSFCNNCIVQGITWNECGTDNYAGLMLTNSSNITINNCSFQYSKGQAILLSEVSGDVIVTNCNFVHNYHYRGHGAAIYYTSSSVTHSHQLSVQLTINDCNFTYNYAKSLVYIKKKISEYNNNMTLNLYSAKFCHNQGVSVYATNQNIYFDGILLFQNNTAKFGAGIYISDYSTVTFGKNSSVTFTENVSGGGTVFTQMLYSMRIL